MMRRMRNLEGRMLDIESRMTVLEGAMPSYARVSAVDRLMSEGLSFENAYAQLQAGKTEALKRAIRGP